MRWRPGHSTSLPTPLLADATLHSQYEEKAASLSGTIHFSEQFDMTLGGRYSENDQEAETGNRTVCWRAARGVFPVATSSEDVFTYSVAPKWKFDDHTSIYVRVASGFRPGGPNVLPPDAPAEVPRIYDSDELTSYEIGLKVESADRAYTLDFAAFHIDWEDIQLFARVNNFGVNINGGEARSDGFEVTASAFLAERINVSFNGAHTDAELEDDTPALSGGRKGDELPFTPEWGATLNANYEWAVGAQAMAYVGGSVRYLSDQSGDLRCRLPHGQWPAARGRVVRGCRPAGGRGFRPLHDRAVREEPH